MIQSWSTYFVVLCVLFIGASWIKFTFYDTQQNYNRTIRNDNSLKVVSEFSEEVDNEWIPIMKYGNIIHCEPFKAFDAYADKFIIEIEGGYKGMIKLMEKQSLFSRALQTIHYNS